MNLPKKLIKVSRKNKGGGTRFLGMSIFTLNPGASVNVLSTPVGHRNNMVASSLFSPFTKIEVARFH